MLLFNQSKLQICIISCIGSFAILGCVTPIKIPNEFSETNIQTDTFQIFSYSKLANSTDFVRVYIEGDGYAFNAHGRPSSDPTPKDSLVRRLAFGDPHQNVIYLARPCQYVKNDPNCKPSIWTNERFSKDVIQAELQAITTLIGNRPIVLIGFSGGAQVAALMSTTSDRLKVRKIITIAGNLDHRRWCESHNLPILKGSLELSYYKDAFLAIPQKHFIGELDKVIDPQLLVDFVGNKTSVRWVTNATHHKNWEPVFKEIWAEN